MHRNFPAQFKYLASAVARNKDNRVIFITNNSTTPSYDGIIKIVYNLKRQVPANCHRYLRFYEEAIIHGQAAAGELLRLKLEGFKPDLIVGHSWGSSLFVKEVFPEVPYIAYIEWYYNYQNSDIDFAKKEIDVNDKASLMCKNSHILQDLVKCDCAISPTEWQKQQVPEIFRNKIKVIHDGIDTDYCRPDRNAEFMVPDTDIVLTKKDKILTYVARGMEEYRGFPEFMKAASILMKENSDLKVVIAGEDRVCYGRKIHNSTFKKEMLKKYEFDMERLYFVGGLPYKDYVNLLRVSATHVYLTYPFVLSWSLMEAMSTECTIVTSDTMPVREVIKDGFNGILVDFYDTDALVSKVNDILSNPEKYKEMSENARKTIVENYALNDMLAKQTALFNEFVKK